MNKTWLGLILFISIVLLTLLKSQEINSLALFYKYSPVIKLTHFQNAQHHTTKEDLPLLKLWESILTGRSAPVSKYMKERYQLLGLSHIFTPSGFHLSAVLTPFMKLLKNSRHQLYALLCIGILLWFLSGFAALKRMLMIKTGQNLLGMHTGFVAALLIDMLLGSFQENTLSFTYSFLFLGIIYAGLKGVNLIIWFYIAQIILALFQGNDVSPLLLIFSPILNIGFGLIMPLLLLLSYPLWDWQLNSGLFLLGSLQDAVDLFATLILKLPAFEVNIVTILILGSLVTRRWKFLLVLIFLFSSSLNLQREKNPGLPTNEFVPSGEIIRTVDEEKRIVVNFHDGRCQMRLIRGYWWENCSPKRRSRIRKTKKLSYL